MYLVNVVDVERPIEDVYAYLADFENVPSWIYDRETEKTSDGPVGVGTTYGQVEPFHEGQENSELTVYEGHRFIGSV